MRFILAAVAFIASAVMLIMGGVQYSQAANVSEVTAIGSSDSSAPVTVIGHDTLASRAGTQSIEIRGDGEFFVAVGRTEDVAAWVGDAMHNTVTLDEEAETGSDLTMSLVFTESGSEQTVPSAVGNDLWFEEHTGENELALDLVVSPGYSLLITSDGTQSAPGEIEISWPFGGYAPMVGPLLTAGAILLVVALALLAWALLHRRAAKREEALAAKRSETSAPVVTEVSDSQDETAGTWLVVSWDDSLAEATVTAPNASAEDAAAGDEPAEEEPAEQEATQVISQEPAPASIATEAEAENGAAASPFAPPVDGLVEPTTDNDAHEQSVASAPTSEGEPSQEAELDAHPEQEPAVETVPERAPAAEDAHDSDHGSDAPAVEETKWRRPRGRDRSSAPKHRFFMAPIMAVAALTLAGCAPQYWPADWTNADIAPTGTPTSPVEAALIEEGAMPPTVNDAQLADIVSDAAAVAAEGDQALDASILEPRFTADALQNRTALYKAKTADDSLAGPIPFPTGDIVYAVPEATDAWPRVVFAVVNPGADAPEGTSPAAIMLVQEDARSNFKVASLTELAAGVALPEAAPVSVGAPSIANLEGPLVMEPDAIAAAYANIIAKGDASEFAAQFDATNDTLRAQVNDAYREGLSKELDPEVISVSFAYAATETAPVGITSIDGGAIVTVSITETETLKAANDRALITVSGRTAVLSGVETSETGFVRTYTDQLLFYVPSADTGGPIQFLGVSQTMTDAKELEKES